MGNDSMFRRRRGTFWVGSRPSCSSPTQILVHPDDHAVQQQTIASVLASGHPVTAIYRLRHKDGHYVWMEAAARPIPSADGGDAMDIIFAGRDVSQRVAAEQALQASRDELEALAHLDSLTGLANRRQFDERLMHALGRSRRQGLAVALMYMDIDHFKQVNDSHGHAAGDEVLRVFGQRLSACVRSGDLVARLGGDEFVVLIEDLSAPETAEAIARKLIESMGEGIVVEDTTLHVTTSIGIAYSAHPAVAKTLDRGRRRGAVRGQEGRPEYLAVAAGRRRAPCFVGATPVAKPSPFPPASTIAIHCTHTGGSGANRAASRKGGRDPPASRLAALLQIHGRCRFWNHFQRRVTYRSDVGWNGVNFPYTTCS